MTPEELAGLLPTAEVLRSWTTVDGAREWAGLSEAVLGEFLSLLGNRTLSNLPLAGAVDPVTVRRTILAVRLPVPADGAVAEGTEGPAGPIPPPRILTALEDPARSLLQRGACEVWFAASGCRVGAGPHITGSKPDFGAS